MVGKTHVLGGMTLTLGAFALMQGKGMLIEGIPDLAQLAVILPYGLWTAKLADFDQDRKTKAEENPINLFIQKFFNATGTPHRGFVSHVLPVLIFGALMGSMWLMPGSATQIILALIFMGCFCGTLSHLLLDMFTSDGVCGGKLRLVPKASIFNAGSDYEKVWEKCLYVVSFALLLVVLYLALGITWNDLALMFMTH